MGGEDNSLSVSGAEEDELPKSVIVTNVGLGVFDSPEGKVSREKNCGEKVEDAVRPKVSPSRDGWCGVCGRWRPRDDDDGYLDDRGVRRRSVCPQNGQGRWPFRPTFADTLNVFCSAGSEEAAKGMRCCALFSRFRLYEKPCISLFFA